MGGTVTLEYLDGKLPLIIKYYMGHNFHFPTSEEQNVISTYSFFKESSSIWLMRDTKSANFDPIIPQNGQSIYLGQK